MSELDLKFFYSINQYTGFPEGVEKVLLLGVRYSIVFFSAVLVYYLFKRQRVFWTGLLAAALSRGILTELIRYFYHRPRPFVALEGVRRLIEKDGLEASFPSGHAAFMFAVAFGVFVYNKKAGAILIALALILSLARVYAGVHYPSDIAGGIMVGAISVYLVRKIIKKNQ